MHYVKESSKKEEREKAIHEKKIEAA